jgi:hypothetical protein
MMRIDIKCLSFLKRDRRTYYFLKEHKFGQFIHVLMKFHLVFIDILAGTLLQQTDIDTSIYLLIYATATRIYMIGTTHAYTLEYRS